MPECHFSAYTQNFRGQPFLTLQLFSTKHLHNTGRQCITHPTLRPTLNHCWTFTIVPRTLPESHYCPRQGKKGELQTPSSYSNPPASRQSFLEVNFCIVTVPKKECPWQLFHMAWRPLRGCHLRIQLTDVLDLLQFAYQPNIGAEDSIIFLTHKLTPGKKRMDVLLELCSLTPPVLSPPRLLKDKLLAIHPGSASWTTRLSSPKVLPLLLHGWIDQERQSIVQRTNGELWDKVQQQLLEAQC